MKNWQKLMIAAKKTEISSVFQGSDMKTNRHMNGQVMGHRK
jgi:hypothetical protein